MTDDADGGTMGTSSVGGGMWTLGNDGSLEEVLDAAPSIPYELLRPEGEIENSRSQPGVPGDEGFAGAMVSRRAMMEPADAAWGRGSTSPSHSPMESGSDHHADGRDSIDKDDWSTESTDPPSSSRKREGGGGHTSSLLSQGMAQYTTVTCASLTARCLPSGALIPVGLGVALGLLLVAPSGEESPRDEWIVHKGF